MRKSVVECVFTHAVSSPHKTAILTEDRTLNYRELWGHAKGYALYLRSCGLKKNAIVVLRASQTVEYVIQYLGIHLAGGIVTSLERKIPTTGLLDVIKQIGATAVIANEDPAAFSSNIIHIPQDNIIEDAMSYYNESADIPFPSIHDSADILFTTGTTGQSKGVELSHNALVATAENLIFGCGYKANTTILVPGPLNHANAIRKLIASLVNGSSIYILNGMTNVKGFFNALENIENNVACCLPPAAIRAIFTLTNDKIAQYKDKIDFIESASAPLPETDKKRLCHLLPKTRLYNNYGSSESASVCMYDYNQYPDKDNCVGKPMPNSKIVIVDDDHKPMNSSKDHIGLIACAGDVNMKGYVNDPELTAETMQDGIVFTNDLGYIDNDGFVYVIGRKGDVINVGGLKVSPSDVESAVFGFEGIADCICIAVKDPITTNALKLLVVMKTGYDLDAKGLASFLSGVLEPYKIPRFYEAVDKIQRTYNGKLDRKFYRQ